MDSYVLFELFQKPPTTVINYGVIAREERGACQRPSFLFHRSPLLSLAAAALFSTTSSTSEVASSSREIERDQNRLVWEEKPFASKTIRIICCWWESQTGAKKSCYSIWGSLIIITTLNKPSCLLANFGTQQQLQTLWLFLEQSLLVGNDHE